MVIVGHRKDSQSYVSMKRKACAEVGIKSFDINLPEQVSEAELISKVHELNANPDVHGWLVIYQIILLVTFTAFGFITKLIELIIFCYQEIQYTSVSSCRNFDLPFLVSVLLLSTNLC